MPKAIPSSPIKKDRFLFINLEKISTKILQLSFCLTFLSLLYYIFRGQESYFHSDTATKILLVESILESGSWFPPNWIYANGDVWLGLGIFPLIIFYALIDNIYLVYSLNSLFYVSIALMTLNYLLNELDSTDIQKWLSRTIFFSAFSYYSASFLFGEIAYLPTFILFCLLLGDAVKLLINGSSINGYDLLFRLIIYTFFFSHNPQRFLVFYVVPFLLVSILFAIDNSKKIRGLIQFAGLLIIPFFLSFLIYNFLLIPNIMNSTGAANLSIVSSELLTKNITRLIPDLLTYLGIQLNTGISVLSLKSIYSSLIYFSSFFFPFYLYFNRVGLLKQHSAVYKRNIFLYLLFSIYFIILSYFYLFYSPLAINFSTIRYLYPIIWCAFLLLILHIRFLNQLKQLLTVSILSITLLLGNYLFFVNSPVPKEHLKFKDIAEFITDNKLKKGYATYWNAGSLELRGEKKFKMAGVHLEPFTPFKWLQDLTIYEPSNHDETFFLAAINEVPDFERIINEKRFPHLIKTKLFETHKLYVFDNDLARVFNGGYYDIPLEHGIDFQIIGYPSFLTSVEGFSTYEPKYRWTEGEKVELNFQEILPDSFSLEIIASPYGPNTGELLLIEVGKHKKEIALQPGFQTYYIDFLGTSGFKKISLTIPKPTSVKKDGKTIDPRKLGIALECMKVHEY